MLDCNTKDVNFRKLLLVLNCGAFIWCSNAAQNKGSTILY